MEGDTLYRSIDGCRGVEDVRPESSTGNGAEEKPRLIGSWPRRKLKDNSTSGSPILLARYAQRRPSPREDAETCMRFKPNQMQAAGKMLTQVPEEP